MAARSLTIGQDSGGRPFTLPPDVVTHTMAILAKKGAGKTYAAGVIEEEFAKSGLPFVVLDPVGVHYGIRSNKDGKRSGHPVVVFGGEHGDIAIDRRMGAAVANAIVEENISCIVDLTELSKTAWREFTRDFCRELYRRNRTPRHVFIEESTEFVPQTRRPELQEAYEAVERLVRLGRNRGLGCTLISQRSAQVAKDVLTQMDVLIALRTVGPQDRKALLDMFESVLEEHQLPQLEEFKRTIARLPDGTAWIWSPEMLDCFVQVKVRERETYHAGATPTFGAVEVIQARPDVSALKARFAAAAVEEVPTKGRSAETGRAMAVLEDRVGKAEDDARHWKQIADGIGPLQEEAERLRGQLVGVEALRQALRVFLGDAGGAGEAQGVYVDEESIVERVLARLPAGRQAVVRVAPPEALRKGYLEATVGRLMSKISRLSADGGEVVRLLLGQDRYWSVNRVALALSGSDSGGVRNRWSKALQELAAVGLVARGGSGRSEYKANVRDCVETELAPHGPTEEEITSVVQNVLYRVTTDRDKR